MRLLSWVLLLCLATGASAAARTAARGLERRRHAKGSVSLVSQAEIVKQTGSDGCEKRKAVPACFLELLKCAAWFLNKHKVPYFMAGGTLLGQKRDKKFIAWDDDIDTTVCTEKTHKTLPYTLIPLFAEEKGENPDCKNVKGIENVSSTGDRPNMRMLHNTCKHCKWGKAQWLDIDNEDLISVNEPKDSKKRNVNAKIIHPIHDCELEGVRVRCPKDEDGYLKNWFGDNYAQPYYKNFDDAKKVWVKADVAKEVKDIEAATKASQKSVKADVAKEVKDIEAATKASQKSVEKGKGVAESSAKAAADKQAAGKQAADKQEADKQVADKQVADKQVADKAAAGKKENDKQVADKAPAGKKKDGHKKRNTPKKQEPVIERR